MTEPPYILWPLSSGVSGSAGEADVTPNCKIQNMEGPGLNHISVPSPKVAPASRVPVPRARSLCLQTPGIASGESWVRWGRGGRLGGTPDPIVLVLWVHLGDEGTPRASGWVLQAVGWGRELGLSCSPGVGSA